MAAEQTYKIKPEGMIGITDDGYPIVTGEYACPYWQAGAEGLCSMHECWYCRFADFRKSSRMTLQKSICRNPRCRIISAGEIAYCGKNEEVECGE